MAIKRPTRRPRLGPRTIRGLRLIAPLALSHLDYGELSGASFVNLTAAEKAEVEAALTYMDALADWFDDKEVPNA